MQSLEAGQATRAKSSHVKAVTLVRVEVMSDVRHGIVDTTYYLAELGLKYDYANTGTLRDFIPMLRSVSDLVSTMRHLPDAGQDQFFERRLSITLANDFYPGGLTASGAGRLIETLRGTSRNKRLIGARVEVSELLIDAWAEPAAPLDLSAFAGSEHTVRFRGVIDRVGPIDEQSIGIACVSSRPREFPWPRALDPIGTPPEFIGRRLPMPYGSTYVPCIPVDVGAVSTLAAALAVTGAPELSSALRFPGSGTTTIQIGKEQITYTGKSGNALTGTTRGANGTVAVAHAAGEVVQEVQTTNVWAVAGAPCEQGMPDLFVRNPFNQNIVRVKGSLLPTYTATNRSAIAGYDCATFAFSNSQLKALLDELGQSSRVTQQPVVSHPTSATLIDDHPTSGDSNLRDGNFGTSEELITSGTPNLSETVTFDAPPGTITRQVIKVNGWSLTQDISVSCGGTIGTIPAGNSQATYQWVTTNTSNSVTVSINSSPAASGRVYEIWRDVTYTESAPTIATNTAIEAQSLGYDLEFFALTNGITIPQAPTASPCHGFNSGTWSNTNCTATLDTQIKTEGASSLKIAIDESHTTLRESCEATTGWGGAATRAADSTWKTQGTNSLKGTAPSTAATNIISPTFGAAVDLTGPSSIKKIIAIDLLTAISEGDRIAVVLHSNGATKKSGWYFEGYKVPNAEPRTILIDYTTATDFATGGGVDPTVWDAIEFTWNNINGATSTTLNVDNIRTFNAYAIASISGLSAQDFNANNAHYQFSMRGAQAEKPRNVFIDFAGTGGLGAGNHYRLNVAQTEMLRPGSWRKWRGVLRSSIGTPAALNAITEIQITVQFQTPAMLHGSYPWDGGLNLTTWIDGIYGRDDTQSPYVVSVGGMCQWGSDALRHWITEAGEVYDEGTADTTLALTRLALDMASSTDGDWGRGLAELARHCRANIVPIEASSGTQWRQLSAKTDYSFPAPTVVLGDDFDARTEAERGLEDLATRFVALIDRDVRIEDTGEAQFVETLVISPGRNDVTAPSRADLETREAAYGQIESEPLVFPGLPGTRLSINEHLFCAKNTIGYYARERSRIADARTVRWDGVPWYELDGGAWALELGDTFEHSLPWDLAAVDFRVIEVQRSFDTRQVNIIAVEVPTT